MRTWVRIAECPVHGLHGERRRCFECGGLVARPVYWRTEAVVVLAVLMFLLGLLFG